MRFPRRKYTSSTGLLLLVAWFRCLTMMMSSSVSTAFVMVPHQQQQHKRCCGDGVLATSASRRLRPSHTTTTTTSLMLSAHSSWQEVVAASLGVDMTKTTLAWSSSWPMADHLGAATTASTSTLLLGEGNALLDTIQTVLVVLTAGAFLIFGISYILAAFIIPKAAEQVEREAKELAPELWDEYQAKLGEGETMATRPDLLQELGNKIQPLIEQKMQRMNSPGQPQPQPPKQQGGDAQRGSSSSSTPSAIDAEIVPDKDDEKKD